MQIIFEAKDLEKQAEKTYASLASQCEDEKGREMFINLSKEENKHYLILNDAYWSLNDTGKWKRPRP